MKHRDIEEIFAWKYKKLDVSRGTFSALNITTIKNGQRITISSLGNSPDSFGTFIKDAWHLRYIISIITWIKKTKRRTK